MVSPTSEHSQKHQIEMIDLIN